MIDKQKILKVAEDVKKGNKNKAELEEMLGGKKLNEIFDDTTKEAILTSIIDNGTIHKMIEDEGGFDILQGLLNNKIVGNMSDFYMIKPSYILALSSVEKRNMANSISANNQQTAQMLMELWDRGIKTEACTTKEKDNIQMVQVNIDALDFENQDYVQSIFNIEDIRENAFYNCEYENFKINLYGKNLYEYIVKEQLSNNHNKKNIFENAVKETIEFLNEILASYNKHGIDSSEQRKNLKNCKNMLNKMTDRKKRSPFKTEPQNSVYSQEIDMESR